MSSVIVTKKKRIKGYLALFLLAISWVALLLLTGDNKTPWQRNIVISDKHIEVRLGDVPVQQYTRMGFTGGMVRYHQASKMWMVGTEQGNIIAVNMKGEQVWKRNFGIGKITTIAFSKNGERMYVGEQSPAGQLYALRAKDGELLWKYSTSEAIGSDPAARSHPSITNIYVDEQEQVYFSAYRMVSNKGGKREYFAKIFVVNAAGTPQWQYPAQQPMDAWVNWFDVNEKEQLLSFSTSNYEVHEQMKYTKNIYTLDLRTKDIKNELVIPPVQPFERTIMRDSPNYSADGRYLAGFASDGRAFVFNASDNSLLWQATISRPRKINGEWLNAVGRKVVFTPYGIVFTTLNTFNRNNWQLSIPVEHPSNNGIFVFDYQGVLLEKFIVGGNTEETEQKGHLLVTAVGRNVRTKDYDGHGVLVIDLKKMKQSAFYRTQGPVQGVDISDDLRYVAAVEAPAQLENGSVQGKYRLHIWELE